MLQLRLTGHFLGHVNPLFRIVLAVAGVLAMIPTFLTDGIGIGLIVVIVAIQFVLNRKKNGGNDAPAEAAA